MSMTGHVFSLHPCASTFQSAFWAGISQGNICLYRMAALSKIWLHVVEMDLAYCGEIQMCYQSPADSFCQLWILLSTFDLGIPLVSLLQSDACRPNSP